MERAQIMVRKGSCGSAWMARPGCAVGWRPGLPTVGLLSEHQTGGLRTHAQRPTALMPHLFGFRLMSSFCPNQANCAPCSASASMLVPKPAAGAVWLWGLAGWVPRSTAIRHRRLRNRPGASAWGSRAVAAGLAVALSLGALVHRANATEPEPSVAANLAELSFDQLMQTKVSMVYAASKREQTVSQAPSAVTILTAEDIRQFGYRTLADLLRSVRGLYVSYDRIYSLIGVRGVNRPGDFGGRVLLMVNGHRLNEPVYDQAFIGGEFPLDVDLIDRVEIVRGPGSVLYGNNAFFGVINVITRPGREVRGLEASGSFASYDTWSGRLTFGHQFTNGPELLVSGTWFDSQGHEHLFFPEFRAVHGGVVDGLDSEYRKQLFASITYQDFTLEGGFGDRKKEVPTAPYPGAIFNRAPCEALDERSWVELRYRHEFTGDWSVQGRLFFDRYRYDGVGWFDWEEPLDPAEAVLNKDYVLAHFWGGEAQVSKQWADRHRLSFGAEFRDDLEVRQKNYDVAPYALYSDVRSDADSFGLYLLGEEAFRTNLTLQAGLRYDHFDTFGGTVNPRAGLIYSPVPPTTLKLLYGQAYRAPNAYEFDYDTVGYKANHDLDPERIRTYELVWEQQLSRPLRLTTCLFYNQIKDLITQQEQPDGTLIFRNTDAVDARGVETELEARWPGGWRGRVSYTFADALDTATDRHLPNSPRHLAKLNVVAPLWREKIFAGLELQGMSDRRSVRGKEVPGFVIANLTLYSRELVKGLEFSASLYNLFDKDYGDPPGPDFVQDIIRQDGRAFRVKLTYRF